MGIFDAFGLLLFPFSNFVQKFKDLVSGNAFDTPFPEILVKPA